MFPAELDNRLRGLEITVPPLRDYREEIISLAEFFREVDNKELECKIDVFEQKFEKRR